MKNKNSKDNLISALESHKAGKYIEAETYYKKVLSQSSSNNIALYYYGLLCFELERPNEAINYILKSIEIDPIPESYSDLANIYADNGNKKKAVEFYKKALEIYPVDASLMYNLAINLIDEYLTEQISNIDKKTHSKIFFKF